MINMPKALMDKADNRWAEEMGKKKDENVNRESKWILDIKNRNECDNFWCALVGSFIEWTWLKKKHEIMSMKTSKTEKKKD